ncbi:unnamed protein product [Dicrocoelium dendriticum]|nr:unnamed protein product [Dicrocoelium dendriticum]
MDDSPPNMASVTTTIKLVNPAQSSQDAEELLQECSAFHNLVTNHRFPYRLSLQPWSGAYEQPAAHVSACLRFVFCIARTADLLVLIHSKRTDRPLPFPVPACLTALPVTRRSTAHHQPPQTKYDTAFPPEPSTSL